MSAGGSTPGQTNYNLIEAGSFSRQRDEAISVKQLSSVKCKTPSRNRTPQQITNERNMKLATKLKKSVFEVAKEDEE